MKIYFIGSTLPFWYFKNKTFSKRDIIVVSKQGLRISFQKVFPKIESNKIKTLEELESGILLKSNMFQIFHECCWDGVDDIIKNYKKKTIYSPVSHINYFDEVTIILLIKILFIYGFSIINFKSIFKYLFFQLFFRNQYNFSLQTNLKDKKTFNLVKNLNHHKFPYIHYTNEAHGFRGSENKKSFNGNTIIFLLGNDVLSISDQMKCYLELIKICKGQGYKVVCKSHPRSDVKYNPKLFDQNLDPHIPFESMEIPYKFKVSLFTTSLIFEPTKSISIENLIRNNLEVDKRFNLRAKFLRGFQDFDKINIPEDYVSFSNLIK